MSGDVEDEGQRLAAIAANWEREPDFLLVSAWQELLDLRSLRRPFFKAWLGEEEVARLSSLAKQELEGLVATWESLDWPPSERPDWPQAVRDAYSVIPEDLLYSPSAFRERVESEIAIADGGPPFAADLPPWVLHEPDGQANHRDEHPPGMGELRTEAGDLLLTADLDLQFLADNCVEMKAFVDEILDLGTQVDFDDWGISDALHAVAERWEAMSWPPASHEVLAWSVPEELLENQGALRARLDELIARGHRGALRTEDLPGWHKELDAAIWRRVGAIWDAADAFDTADSAAAIDLFVYPPLPLPPVGTRRPARPEPRLIRQWSDAEQAACDWMRWMGFADAALTPPGADGGADVVASDAVAQVKDWGGAIPIAEVQRMVGVAAERGRDLRILMFARAGYTQQAIESAERLEIALFEFDLTGEPAPITTHARKLMAE